MSAVVLFAGAGGWDVAARGLGIETHGVEYWAPAVATQRAAGLTCIRADVRDCDLDHPWYRTPGLIASPPCQTFSMAGKGQGRAVMDEIAARILDGDTSPDGLPEGSALMLEPLRWIQHRLMAEQPYQWIAFEQVPTCLPLWVAYATTLRGYGYNVACGNLSAEQYGTPQTRKRAILMAHLGRPVALPTPTHSRYHNRDPRRLDEGVAPWVSMAQALGWSDDLEVVSNYGTGGDASNRGVRQGAEPSATITGKAGRNVVQFRSDNRPNTAVRDLDQPAPTILGNGSRGTHASWFMGDVRSSHGCVRPVSAPSGALTASMDNGNFRWVSLLPAGRSCPSRRTADEPAPTLTGGGNGVWARTEDYSEAVRGSSAERRAALPEKQWTQKVQVEQAAILQGFPGDYPWQGTRSEQYTQVGNAIPVQLARAVLSSLIDLPQ